MLFRSKHRKPHSDFSTQMLISYRSVSHSLVIMSTSTTKRVFALPLIGSPFDLDKRHVSKINREGYVNSFKMLKTNWHDSLGFFTIFSTLRKIQFVRTFFNTYTTTDTTVLSNKPNTE